MITVRINRKTWLRGNRLASCLLNKSGEKCCIGFLALKLRLRKKDILNIGSLSAVETLTDQARDFHSNSTNYQALNLAYAVNDNQGFSESLREQKLKIVGKEMNVNFVFYN